MTNDPDTSLEFESALCGPNLLVLGGGGANLVPTTRAREGSFDNVTVVCEVARACGGVRVLVAHLSSIDLAPTS